MEIKWSEDHLNVSCAKYWPFCSGFKVLILQNHYLMSSTSNSYKTRVVMIFVFSDGTVFSPITNICCHEWQQNKHHKNFSLFWYHMSIMVTHISSRPVVYLRAYSGEHKRKYQSSHHWPFMKGIHWWPMDSLHKGPVMRKALSYDDVIIRFSVCISTQYLLTSILSVSD